MEITNEVVILMKNNMQLRNRLALELNKHYSTINLWIAKNDIRLTCALSLKIISEELKMSAEQIMKGETANV